MQPFTQFASGSFMSIQKTVLVVDDEELLRSYLVYELGKMGLSAVEAGTGKEALVVAGTQKFDLIITDLRMPDMNGVELLRQIRNGKGQLPPVVVITGDALGAEVQKERLAIVAVLMKPFFPAEIKSAVEKALASEITAASA